jgi:tripartite-type tricarboxylate transporter receptor subunit TctC
MKWLASKLLLLFVVFTVSPIGLARAEGDYPTKVVTIIVGYPPGGPTDLYARALAQGLSELWHRTVIVENRAGASGAIGAMQALRAPADGYTLFFSNNATNGAYELMNPKSTQYRTMKDFAPVGLFGVVPNLLVVRSGLPAKNMTEFVALAKAKPGSLTYGISAFGSAPHLASELLQEATGIELRRIPFNGAGPLMQSLMGGDIDMYIGGASTVLEQVKSGRIRAIATLHKSRLKMAPDVPTLEEQGIKGADYDSWYGLLAPAGVPAPLLDRLNADVRKVMATKPIQDALEGFGVEYFSATRPEFLRVIKEEIDRSGALISKKHITVE